MASTFTPLGIEKMATGENAGTWGTKTNTNLDIIEKAIAGYVEVAVTSGGTKALSITDGDATENTSVAMPMRNLISIIIAVAIGVYAYFGVIERLNRLETSDILFAEDLLKKADQTPKNLELFMLIEELYKQTDKHQILLDKNIHTQVKLDHIEVQLEKALRDIEKLKDKVRKNGNSH